MCGICGLIAYDAEFSRRETYRAVVKSMCTELAHRGPDDWGIEVLGGPGGARDIVAILGHRRLSVVDVRGGHQPMSNENGDVWTVYNGEIYNHMRLRSRLRRSGHELQTQCDTECLIHLYEDQGQGCVDELRGMFAFAVWDEKRGLLTLGRDRMGQKPLFYFHDENKGVFAFASELKALLQIPQFRKTISPRAIAEYLTYQYVPHPQCIFDRACKLAPAHLLQLDVQSGQVSHSRYWRPDFNVDSARSLGSLKDELYDELRRATQMRLMSDVPVGAFLSGGVDSSITVALMSELMDEPVRTFSIGFDNPGFDETEEAKLVARHCRTHHVQETVRPQALDLLPELVWHYDEPFADSSAIPTYYVSQLASQDVKVVLTGDAGDECFAGYSRYAGMWLGEKFDKLPNWMALVAHPVWWRHIPGTGASKNKLHRLRRFMRGLNQPSVLRYLDWVSVFRSEQIEHLMTDGIRDSLGDVCPSRFLSHYFDELPRGDWVHRTTYVDAMTYLPGDLLTKVDVASMAHGLEARSPFLDHRVVELAGTIPTRYKLRPTCHGLQGKTILRETFADLLPRPIVRRRKMGFGVPIGDWFRGDLREVAYDVLLGKTSRERGYFRMSVVRRLIEEHVNGEEDHAHRLWALLMLELWHREFVDEGPLGL
ncbi:MAG: asparagine synthase (glutamine-hydrolyzing) [Planctomycetota bacterium]